MELSSKFYHKLNRNTIDKIEQWKSENKKIVFTNGCFDILHCGHIKYLQEAKSLGQKLIVGLNSDASVKRLKGNDRPVNTQECRGEVLAALEAVDLVVVFEEDTPIEIISKIVPDVLVKGGDWKIEDIVGSDVVLKNGGEVKSLSFVQGVSTTSIIDKIKNN